jgi:hypothetical protein
MNKQQQLILAIAALVVVGAVSSVVTWLIVRDNGGGGGKAAAPAVLRRISPALKAGVGDPPPDAQKIADDKKANPDKLRAGDKVTAVGAPNPQPADQCDANGPPTAFAEWRFEPDTLDQGKSKAKDIVYGEVMSVEAGPDQVIAVPTEPGGEIRTPTQTIQLQVTKSYKGGKKNGGMVTLFQVGNACVRIANDPMYKKGEKALLMLEDGPRGQMQIVSPEGRYRQGPDGTLNPVIDNPATEKLKGKKPDDVGAILGS